MCVYICVCVYIWDYLLAYILCLGEHLLVTKLKQQKSAFHPVVYFCFLSFFDKTLFFLFVHDVRFFISENVSKSLVLKEDSSIPHQEK